MARRLTLRSVFLLAMLALVLLGAAVYSVIAYQVRKADLVQAADVQLRMAGHVARTVVGPGYHDRIADATSITKEEFARIVAAYDELCQQLGLQYIWSLMELDGQLVFTSATHTVLTNQHSACATFLEVHTNPEAYRHALATMQPEFATFHDKWGAGRMVLLPAWDQKHRKHLFAASVQLAGFEALLSRALRESVMVSLIVAALFSLLALWLSRLFTRPLTRLTSAIERMGRGELDHPLVAGGVQELQLLADTFDAMRQTVRQQLAALRASEEKYTRLVTHIEDVLYSVDAVTREFRYLSPAFQKMFGYTLEDIRQLGGRRPFLAAVIQGGRFQEQDDYLHKLQQAPVVTPFRSVAWWRCKDGSRRYIRDNWMPVYEAGQLVSTEGILTDITREKAAEDKLQESEALLKEAQQLAKLGNWSWDVRTDEVTWSDELYDMWGLDRSQPVPSMAQHKQLFPPECWPRVQALLQHAAQTGEEYMLETEFLRHDGIRGHLIAHGLSSRDKDGRVLRLYGTAQDVTERKRLQQQLLEISEREQRRIGQDLHDGVGQQLAAMRFQSSTLLQKLAGRRKVTIAEVERLDSMLEETLRQVRDLSRGLHPVSVDSHGLMHGLRELARQSLALFGVPCAFDCAENVLVLDQRAAVNLYRIAQEAVRNAAVHGAPKQISIHLSETGGLLRLTIQDDGCGLPPDLKASTGLGLEIMRYRAASIGATCEILSQPGAGVTVQCGWRAPT